MIMIDSHQNLSSKLSTKKDSSETPIRRTNGQGPKGDFVELLKTSNSDSCVVERRRNMPEAPSAGEGMLGAVIPLLKSIREPLADYQEKKGISKTQNYTFLALISTVTQYIYSVLLSLGNMVYNLFPIIDAFLLILRFLLDKGIDCLQAESNDRYIKSAVFFVEFIAIVILILAISGLILVPLSVLFGHIFHKVWNAVF